MLCCRISENVVCRNTDNELDGQDQVEDICCKARAQNNIINTRIDLSKSPHGCQTFPIYLWGAFFVKVRSPHVLLKRTSGFSGVRHYSTFLDQNLQLDFLELRTLPREASA